MILGQVASTLGIPLWALIILIIWATIWKALALWKSARNGSEIWFIILFFVSTAGILEISYIFYFSKIKFKKKKKKIR